MVTVTQPRKTNTAGEILDQISVGGYILRIGNVHGGLVDLKPPGSEATAEPRARPVSLKPRPFPQLLDREIETATIRSALDNSSPVSVFGDAGIGKTALLRRIAHTPGIDRFRDGLVYLGAKGKRLDDLLQLLYDVFYTSPPNTKPTDGEIRQGLQNLEALVLLDDIEFEQGETELLLNVMPASTFVLASAARLLWGEGQVVELSGLPDPYAYQLFEKNLGRPLSDEERDSVRGIVAALEDHPMRILQLAALARSTGAALSQLRDRLPSTNPDTATAQLSVRRLSEPHRKVVAIIGAASGAVMPHSHLAAVSRVGHLHAILDELISLGLVQAHSPRYSLTAVMSAALPSLVNLRPWEELLINHLSTWVANSPSEILMEESSDLLWHMITKAAERKQWDRVAQIGRALEPYLILWKRWQAWSDLVNVVLNAARAAGDRHLEAWALHQMGTRAMCLGGHEQARNLLSQALEIRRAISDRPGMAVTAHNLNVLNGVPIRPQTKIKKRGGPGGGFGLLSLLVILIVLIGAGGVLASPEVQRRISTLVPVPTSFTDPTQVVNLAESPTSVPPTEITSIAVTVSTNTSVLVGVTPVVSPPTETSTATSASIGGQVAVIAPPFTDTFTPTASQMPTPCYQASLIKDVTYPDGTLVQPGASFIKTWELKNEGSCMWDASYQIAWVDGDQLSASQTFPWSGGVVSPGASVQVSVTLTAPDKPGAFQSYFMLLPPGGKPFGVNPKSSPFWVRIQVSEIATFTPTFTVMPDVQGPYSPTLVYPVNETIPCEGARYVDLTWKAAYDDSGIAGYEVYMEYSDNGETWIPWNTWNTEKLTRSIEAACGYWYRWTVRARDWAGNSGEYGPFEVFQLQQTTPG